MRWLYFALIALCMIAAYACELCHWATMAIILAVDLVGVILARHNIEIPRFSKVIAVLLFVAFIAIEISGHPGIQVFFLNSFLNLVWAMLGYRALSHVRLSERLQVGIIALLPLACVAIRLQASTFLLFLFAYFVIWIGFLAGQSLTEPNTGTLAVSQNLGRGVPAGFWLTTSVILILALGMGSFLFMVVPRYGASTMSPVPSLDKVSGQFPDVALDRTGDIRMEPTLIFRAEVSEDLDGDNIYWRVDVQNIFNGSQWFSMGSGEEPAKSLSEMADKGLLQSPYHLEFAHDWYDRRVPTLADTSYIAVSQTQDESRRIQFNRDKTGVWRQSNWKRGQALTDIDYWLDEAPSLGLQRGRFSMRMIWPGRNQDETNRRLTEMAQNIVGEEASNERKAIKIRDYLRQNYRYSLKRPQRTGMIVEDFLYRQHFGHCEVFSTTMAVLLARLDVPVRNVTGFVSNEFHDEKNYVRAAHAHSWVEVWLDDERGWVVFDPTPSGAQTVEVDWLVRFDDWFSGYQTRDLYRWIQQNYLKLLAVLLCLAVAFGLLAWPVRFIQIRLMPVDKLCQKSWEDLQIRLKSHAQFKDKTLESWWSDDCTASLEPVKTLAQRLIELKYRPNVRLPSTWSERFKYNHETLRLYQRASRAIDD